MNYNESINFLLFSYFGFDMNDTDNEILAKIVYKAYRDASNQGAFNALLSKDDIQLKSESNNCSLNAIEYVCKAFIEYSKTLSKQKWHKSLCEDVTKIFSNICKDGKPCWSDGNSQKMVNMTIKYVNLVSLLFNECKKKSIICNISKKLSTQNVSEIPVDSFIIEAAKEAANDIDIPKREKTAKPWSTWDYDDYCEFKQEIQEKILNTKNMNLADWEQKAWIDKAKKKRINKNVKTIIDNLSNKDN